MCEGQCVRARARATEQASQQPQRLAHTLTDAAQRVGTRGAAGTPCGGHARRSRILHVAVPAARMGCLCSDRCSRADAWPR